MDDSNDTRSRRTAGWPDAGGVGPLKQAAPASLRRGDVVGVVSTGFAVRPGRLRDGVARLQRMGYRPRVGSHATSSHGYLAGDDEARLGDLRTMLEDPEVRAIWFARGGYGTARLLDRVPWRLMKARPRLLIGYSDLTALFNAAVQRAGATCLYGPVVSELGDAASYNAPSLRKLLAGRPSELKFLKRQVLAPGRASGPLLGGNLSTLAHLCGGRFFPDLRGAILFIEDTGERVYRIDRMLTQLRHAGALRHLAGVLLGDLNAPPRTHFPADRELRDVLDEFFGPLGVPVIGGLPVGHVPAKRTIPLGAETQVDTAAGRVRFGA